MSLLFSDKAGVSRCSTGSFSFVAVPLRGREGGKEVAFLFGSGVAGRGRHKWWFVVFMLTTFVIVFMLFLFLLLYQNPEMAGQK